MGQEENKYVGDYIKCKWSKHNDERREIIGLGPRATLRYPLPANSQHQI